MLEHDPDIAVQFRNILERQGAHRRVEPVGKAGLFHDVPEVSPDTFDPLAVEIPAELLYNTIHTIEKGLF